MTPLLTLRQAADRMAYKDLRTLKKALARAGICTIGTGRAARLAPEDIDLLIARARTWSTLDIERPAARSKTWKPTMTPEEKRAQTRRARAAADALTKGTAMSFTTLRAERRR